MAEQPVGNGIGIRPGNDLVQKQLQNLNIRKMIQPLFPGPLPDPLPVAFVHMTHSL